MLHQSNIQVTDQENHYSQIPENMCSMKLLLHNLETADIHNTHF